MGNYGHVIVKPSKKGPTVIPFREPYHTLVSVIMVRAVTSKLGVLSHFLAQFLRNIDAVPLCIRFRNFVLLSF